MADGSLEPYCDDNDDPKWDEAMASPEREFWIAGAREELQSLEDLQVFVLVPRSTMPKGQRPSEVNSCASERGTIRARLSGTKSDMLQKGLRNDQESISTK